MGRSRTRNAVLLLVAAVVLTCAAAPLLDGLLGMVANLSDDVQTPHEVYGMLPSEWRELRDRAWMFVVIIVVFGSWFVGYFVINRAKRYETGAPACESCGYSLLALPKDSVCPECGSSKRVLFEHESIERRLAVVAAVQFIGTGGLLLCLFALLSDEPGLNLFHAAMTLPVALFVMDKRLSVTELAIVSSITLLTICSLTTYSVWDSSHSGDGQAAFGLIGASCSGWMLAGPGYLAAAVVVFFYRRHQTKRA